MNALRVSLTILALVMDGLCIALIGLTFLTRHLNTSGLVGVSMFLVVIVSNIPALVLALTLNRPRHDDRATAGVFE
jgi:hypothetical protein